VTYAERVLDYLWSVLPGGATNSQIARQLDIRSHQTVYMTTQDLLRRRLVRAQRDGHEWTFYAVEDPSKAIVVQSRSAQHVRDTATSGGLGPRQFEVLARRVLSEHYGALLSPGSIPGVRKEFDLVSPDRKIVGDAKYYTLVRGLAPPPAKFSVIAEHVWLLEKTGAPSTFLVFGNDRHVPMLWLQRYGHLATSVDFFFLGDDGTLEVLRPASRDGTTHD
jgi:hypothetical protein